MTAGKIRPAFATELKIISGGQTGADRTALDWALAHGVPYGGWCPKGRWAEDGPIKEQYQLQETPDSDPAQRTKWNVRDADATVIFSINERLSGGSLQTLEFARQFRKPCLHVCQSKANHDWAAELRAFIRKHQVKVFNIGGPRASEEPEVGAFVRDTLDRVFGQ